MISSTNLLLFIIFVLGLFYFWTKRQLTYWKRKNIPHKKPIPIFGNLKDVFFTKKNITQSFQELYYDKIFENESIVGIYVFHTPALFIREPELIKRILIKDFNKFPNRYSKADTVHDKLGAYNLFFLNNFEWKIMRSKISPTFTSGKMKQMFSLINDVGKKLDQYLCELSGDSFKKSHSIEIRQTCALYTTDVIGSFAFGIEVNSLRNPNCEFQTQSKKIFDFNFRRAIDFTIIFFLPHWASALRTKLFGTESANFLRTVINDIMTLREKSKIIRNDLIDILIQLKNQSSSNENSSDKNQIKFTIDMLVSQAAVFFIGGFEPSSSTMGFLLYELSKNPEIQNRLRQEIKDIFKANNGDITYEAIQSMKYLNMVIQEILRMYPIQTFLDRECTLSKDEDGYSLEPFSDYKIPHRMPVYIPIYAIQHDPKYFPNPDNFDPERFSKENKDNIMSSIYLPFGSGPRNCIGERFAIMQVKIGIIHFLKNHSVRPSSKSPEVMKLNRKAFTLQAEGGIHCEIVKDPLFQ